MNIYLHQTHHTIGDFEAIFATLSSIPTGLGSDVHLFPELFLTGYPLGDLVLYEGLKKKYNQLLEKINTWSCMQIVDSRGVYLMGGVFYDDANGRIHNCIYALKMGHNLEIIYTKKNLPHYDIFDECKYFQPSPKKNDFVWNWQGRTFLLFICEDIWQKSTYSPLHIEFSSAIDGVFILNASPYHYNKQAIRQKTVLEIHERFNAPVFYVNRVGGEDEILFDGASFIVDNGAIVHQAKSFTPDQLSFDMQNSQTTNLANVRTHAISHAPTPWDEYSLCIGLTESLNWDQIWQALIFGIKEYAYKNSIERVVLGLSGGLDSALVLSLLTECFPLEMIYPVFLPTKHTSILSNDLATKLCKKLGVNMVYYPIKFIQSTIERQFEVAFTTSLNNIAYENVQSRIRGMSLLTIANQLNAFVINTSNKSEIAVGYSTIYGDSIGAISPLGDLFKTQVTALAWHLHRRDSRKIPVEIIERAPTAELHDGQLDSDTLPPYDQLDAILEMLLSQKYTQESIIQKGFSPAHVKKTFTLFERSEFKRKQFPPILKLSPKSFGFGHRVGISKATNIFG